MIVRRGTWAAAVRTPHRPGSIVGGDNEADDQQQDHQYRCGQDHQKPSAAPAPNLSSAAAHGFALVEGWLLPPPMQPEPMRESTRPGNTM